MSLEHLTSPPSSPLPYLLSAFTGETISIPTSNSVMRLLVTGPASSSAFGVVSTEGKADKPIGFHYHNDAHDVFICLKGRVAVWAETQTGERLRQARVLEPGDFASVPPKTIHQYQMLADHTGFMGLIVPGGWEAFFRTIGEPCKPFLKQKKKKKKKRELLWVKCLQPSPDEGATFPTNDERPFHSTLLPRLQKAAAEHDMVPVPQHKYWEPSGWHDSKESHFEALPNALMPYFLRACKGPKWRLGGWVSRKMCGMTEAASRFTVVEMSGLGETQELPIIKFQEAHHCFFVIEGALNISLATEKGTPSTTRQIRVLTAGETGFIPANRAFAINWASRWGRAYVFCNKRGLPGIVEDIGEIWKEPVANERGPGADQEDIEQLAGKTKDFVVV